MAFDKSLDKELFSETIQLETTRITVAVFSYNEGIPKLQISRENLNPTSGEYRFSKLGRMIEEEAVAVLPLMQKALPFLKENSDGASEEAPAEEASEEKPAEEASEDKPAEE